MSENSFCDKENNLFDIVIPLGPHDTNMIERQLEYTKMNIIGYRNIYFICYDSSMYRIIGICNILY